MVASTISPFERLPFGNFEVISTCTCKAHLNFGVGDYNCLKLVVLSSYTVGTSFFNSLLLAVNVLKFVHSFVMSGF